MYEWVIEGRNNSCGPIFVNAYLRRCPRRDAARNLENPLPKSSLRVPKNCVIASGGMSHFPEHGNTRRPILSRLLGHCKWKRATTRLAEAFVANNWTFGKHGNAFLDDHVRMIGDQPANSLRINPRATTPRVMRFLPTREPENFRGRTKGPANYKFKGSEGYEFYKHPSLAYKLNKFSTICALSQACAFA